MHKTYSVNSLQSEVKVSAIALSVAEALAYKKQWIALESKELGSGFVQWHWISSWLHCLPADTPMTLITMEISDEIVGLALFAEKFRFIYPLRIKQLWLHRSGQVDTDQCWIEHNGAILKDQLVACLEPIFYQFLYDWQQWDELYIGLSAVNSTHPLCQQEDILHRVEINSVGYKVNLTNCFNLDDYLAQLSRNTRSQVNRSKRLLLAAGELCLEIAEDKQTKAIFYREMADIHRERWSSTQYGSGFDNPIFYDFHHRLISEDIENKHTKLFKLIHKKQVLGYIYLITDATTWYFYLSALHFHTDNKIKVGHVFHTLVIEQAIKKRVKTYDFLAGDAQYKKSLSNMPQYCQQLSCYYRKKPLLIFREWLRGIKQRMFKQLFKVSEKQI